MNAGTEGMNEICKMRIFLMLIVNMDIHQHFNCHGVNQQYYYLVT